MDSKHRTRLISAARNSAATYASIFAAYTDEALTIYRDTGDGWTALEALCHVRDFDEIFRTRAARILEENGPELVPVDHDQLVTDRRYNEQNPAEVVLSFQASRTETLALFERLTADDWARAGHHPERDTPFTLDDALLQVATHDITHLEQVTRTLAEARTS